MTIIYLRTNVYLITGVHVLEIYDYEFAICSAKVRMTLSERQVHWTRRRLDLGRFEQKTPAYLTLNPNGVVPTVIIDGGARLIEADIINQYIDASLLTPSLVPQNPLVAARLRLWLKEIEGMHPSYGLILYSEAFITFWRMLPKSEVDECLGRFASKRHADQFRHIIDKGMDEARVSTAHKAFRSLLERADERLAKSRFLLGDDFTLADISLAPYVGSPLGAAFDHWQGRLRHVGRWFEEIRARPSFRAAILDYAPEPLMREAITASPGGGQWPI